MLRQLSSSRASSAAAQMSGCLTAHAAKFPDAEKCLKRNLFHYSASKSPVNRRQSISPLGGDDASLGENCLLLIFLMQGGKLADGGREEVEGAVIAEAMSSRTRSRRLELVWEVPQQGESVQVEWKALRLQLLLKTECMCQ